jgi:cation:H+ antiporter
MDLLLLLIGLALLLGGGDALVRGASALAHRVGISPLVVGLTVVSFGTSAPELAVNLTAAWRGSGELSFGNVIGSNLANIGLIVGLTALLRPFDVQSIVVRRELPMMLLATAVVFVFALGPVLAGALATAGLVALVMGAHFTVEGAVGIARDAGISEAVIGLTVIAIGTSLPELAASLVAVWRGQAEIAIGNVVGSNIFNLLLVMGATATLRPIPLPAGGVADLAVLSLLSVLLWVVCATRKRRIIRDEGALLLTLYVVYLSGRALL